MLKPKKYQPCIYTITNTVNSKRYVGSAVQFFSRKSRHRKLLCNNEHHSPHLQAAWNKYGGDSFEFIVLEYCTKETLIEREQYWMDHYNAANPKCGYNIAPTAGSSLGLYPSDETKRKISKARKALNWKPSPEHIAKLKVANAVPHPEWRRRQKDGEGNPNAKLTSGDVAIIKAQLAHGVEIMRIAERYQVTYNCIWEIAKGIKWQEVEPDAEIARLQLSFEEARDVIIEYLGGDNGSR